MPERIALIFDFDDTLAPDSTTGFLEFMGHDPQSFWKDTVDPLLDDGWDPAMAYLFRLIELSKSLPSEQRFTRQKLIEWGKKIKFYKGVSGLFKNLNDEIAEISAGKKSNIVLEYFVISSGIFDVLRSTVISKHFTQIWSSSLSYTGENEEIYFPRNVISFTDKTRYLFQISKGIIGDDFKGKPFEVNKRIEPADYYVPFNRMIFIGDGYTDIPCFSLIQKTGGTAIAVFDKDRRDKWERAWAFTEDKRVAQLASTDYRKTSDLYSLLIMAIEKI
ncbi:MAG: haloacid dehalogenase-like hydrolase, partial [bacterium]|nr:haloacid dehalogenase-like hydrolase [bacterium]